MCGWQFAAPGCYDTAMADSSQVEADRPELRERILLRIREQGRVTFADYMQMALYEPGLGYYMTAGNRSGRDGDYFTAPELHPLFGRLVGRQIVEMAELIDHPHRRTHEPITIVEMGGGRGLMADDLLAECERAWPGWPERLRYHVVELSPSLVDAQRRQLSKYADAGLAIRWLSTLDEAIPADGRSAIIVSNELIDAFPVHRVVVRDGELLERYVTVDGDRLAEVVDTPSTADLAGYFQALGITLPEGYTTEVNLRAVDWMTRVGRLLQRGYLLTIDYGHTAEERYAPARRHGTLACYAGHRRLEDPFSGIGRRDLTSHVDFSALVRAGRQAGLDLAGYTDQASFLMGLGGAELMEARLDGVEGVQREVELAAMKLLLAPEGMGRIFKVLVQQKGMAAPLLRGLQFRPFLMPRSFQL